VQTGNLGLTAVMAKFYIKINGRMRNTASRHFQLDLKQAILSSLFTQGDLT